MFDENSFLSFFFAKTENVPVRAEALILAHFFTVLGHVLGKLKNSTRIKTLQNANLFLNLIFCVEFVLVKLFLVPIVTFGSGV